jgi:hypothetical protein
MTAYARWARQAHPEATGWHADYAFTAPLLDLNTLMALLSAIGVFLVVRTWSVRHDLAPPQGSAVRAWIERTAARLTGARVPRGASARRRGHESSPQPRPFHGLGRGLLAAILFWLNPALLVDAHAWPQWDVWPVPFFVFALLAASHERWLVTGALLAVGAMLKGQILLVAPFFVLWPLFSNAPRAATRVVVGFFGAAAVIAAPWLVGHGAIWVAGVVLVPLVLARKAFRARPLAPVWITVPIALELILWPLIVPAARAPVPAGVLAGLAVILVAAGRRLCTRWIPCQIGFAAAAALFLCPVLFDGSMSWFKVGFAYGAAKFPEMTVGAENLAALLERHFGLAGRDGVWTIDLPAFFVYHVVTVKELLGGIYLVTLVVAAIAAAVHSTRRDPRVLVAAVLPWAMCFALLTQMHERYLVWAACLSALWVAAGVGMTLVHLLLTGLAFVMIAQSLTEGHAGAFPAFDPLLRATAGGLSWLVLLVAGLALFGALVSTRRSSAA